MSLKIVGRTAREHRFMRVAERRQKPQEAKGVTLHCDGCDRDFGVVFPYGASVLKRQELMKAAADEHRRVGCTVGAAEDKRLYTMNYQRL